MLDVLYGVDGAALARATRTQVIAGKERASLQGGCRQVLPSMCAVVPSYLPCSVWPGRRFGLNNAAGLSLHAIKTDGYAALASLLPRLLCFSPAVWRLLCPLTCSLNCHPSSSSAPLAPYHHHHHPYIYTHTHIRIPASAPCACAGLSLPRRHPASNYLPPRPALPAAPECEPAC